MTLLAAPSWAGNAWISLDVGNEWVYAVDRRLETERSDQSGRAAVERRQGALAVRVAGPARLGPGIFVVEGRRRWAGQASQAAGLDGFAVLASVRNGALLEHAVDVGQGLNRHPSPRITIPATLHAGMTWEIGTVEQGGLQIALRGELVGLQDAETAAGRFPHCLKIRYSGEVRGTLPFGEGELPIHGGAFEAVSWFAKGVGEVMARETLETRMLTTRGLMTRRFVEQRSLRRYQLRSGSGGRRSVPARARR